MIHFQRLPQHLVERYQRAAVSAQRRHLRRLCVGQPALRRDQVVQRRAVYAPQSVSLFDHPTLYQAGSCDMNSKHVRVFLPNTIISAKQE